MNKLGGKFCDVCSLKIYLGKRCYDCRIKVGHESKVTWKVFVESIRPSVKPWSTQDLETWMYKNQDYVEAHRKKLRDQLVKDGFWPVDNLPIDKEKSVNLANL